MKGNQFWINPPYFWGVGTLAMLQRTPKDWWVCWLTASAYLKRNSPLTPLSKISNPKGIFWVDDFPFPVVGSVKFPGGSFILNPQKMEVFWCLDDFSRVSMKGLILRFLKGPPFIKSGVGVYHPILHEDYQLDPAKIPRALFSKHHLSGVASGKIFGGIGNISISTKESCFLLGGLKNGVTWDLEFWRRFSGDFWEKPGVDFLLAPYLAEPIGQTDVELGLLGVPSVASAGGESTGSAWGEAVF